MKKLSLVLVMAALIASGCSQKELSREEAYKLISKEKQYPKVLDYDMFYSDPQHAARVLNKGLESDGLVTVDRTQKLKDVGKPLIHFTDKAKPFLIGGPSDGIQKVKIADQEMGEITAIIPDKSNNTAIVEYTVLYKNITPFSVLLKRDLNKPEKKEAYFVLADTGWMIRRQKM